MDEPRKPTLGSLPPSILRKCGITPSDVTRIDPQGATDAHGQPLTGVEGWGIDPANACTLYGARLLVGLTVDDEGDAYVGLKPPAGSPLLLLDVKGVDALMDALLALRHRITAR